MLRHTSFDGSLRSCLRVWDDPTPPTPPIFNLYLTCMRAWSWVCMLACTCVSHRAYNSMTEQHLSICSKTRSGALCQGTFTLSGTHTWFHLRPLFRGHAGSREGAWIVDHDTEEWPRCAPSIGSVNIFCIISRHRVLSPCVRDFLFFIYLFIYFLVSVERISQGLWDIVNIK